MSTNLLYNSFGWLGAIEDAKAQLRTANKARAAVLRDVIAVFTEKMNSGELWPGDEKAGTAAESIPA